MPAVAYLLGLVPKWYVRADQYILVRLTEFARQELPASYCL